MLIYAIDHLPNMIMVFMIPCELQLSISCSCLQQCGTLQQGDQSPYLTNVQFSTKLTTNEDIVFTLYIRMANDDTINAGTTFIGKI